MSEPRVFFDQGPLGGGTLFQNPLRLIRADHPDEAADALEALQTAQDAGHWLAGYASYELGYLFSRKLRALLPQKRNTPFLLFGVFERPEKFGFRDVPQAPVSMTKPVAQRGKTDYAGAFDRIKSYIAAGDIYQANLTFPLAADRTGTVDDLYCLLRQRQEAKFGALVDLDGPVLLSRSPEQFFTISATGALEARPMKGTVARGGTPAEDTEKQRWLANSEKNRAENLMIVDLLRNDVSRISQIGSVKVPELFNIETYATLHQMTSRITAQLRDDVRVPDLFAALFPCGSITGAPKIRAMQILYEVEQQARDAYCGAIGWLAPDGSASFGVTIRTLACADDNSVRLDVGGGIVHDSQLDEEYAEALLKSRFAVLDNAAR